MLGMSTVTKRRIWKALAVLYFACRRFLGVFQNAEAPQELSGAWLGIGNVSAAPGEVKAPRARTDLKVERSSWANRTSNWPR
jgi:hypothetical protein